MSSPSARRRFYAVPGFDLQGLTLPAQVEWIRMRAPMVPDDASAVIVADFRQDHGPIWDRMLAEAAVQGRTVLHSKQVLESLTGRVSIEHLSENNFGSLMPNLAWRKTKRAVDLLSALLLLPPLLPLLLLVGLWIRIDSPGPALFRQMRVGSGGRPFRIFKFRTMHPDRRRRPGMFDGSDRRRTHKHPEDPRLTPSGRLLRKLSLDELPQLFNVLRGDMSLVGPRPELPHIVDAYYEPWQHRRHAVKPGITGLWQISERGNGMMHEHVDVDLDYVDQVGLGTDLWIMARTLPAALSSRQGY